MPWTAVCRESGTLDNVFQFGSTSKITFAGGGVAFLGSSEANLTALGKHLAMQTIGPDKVNQLRHVRFLRDGETISAHMAKHRELIRPRFEIVLDTLHRELADTGMGTWTAPPPGPPTPMEKIHRIAIFGWRRHFHPPRRCRPPWRLLSSALNWLRCASGWPRPAPDMEAGRPQ